MVFGMDFLRKVKAMSLSFLRLVAILEEKTPCIVSTVIDGSPKTLLLSAMQMKKGLKGKKGHLATLKKEKNDSLGKPVPKEIEEVLDEFKDVMPPELPKRLPPRREGRS